MRVTRRHVAPGDLDYELIWLCVSAGSFGLAAIWLAVGLPWPRCAFHDLTGLPCMTCGMTRCAIRFFHCHFLAAWKWNPLVFVALCGLAIFDAYALIVLVMGARRLRIALESRAERKYARILVLGLLAVNWAYLLSHWQKY